MNENLIETLSDLNAKGEAFVLVTLLGARGSTPRGNGTKMVVTAEHRFDTIGGGQLEYKVIETARQLLADENRQQYIEHYPLGPSLGQCCGGSTGVLFERFAARRVTIALFGAGHVGRALVTILGQLPCRVNWIDSRETEFPQTLPANIQRVISDTPAAEVAAMPEHSYYLVMTHNHPLDFAICEAVLKRGHFKYLGLIGSKTKWRRFEQRFEHRGYPRSQVQRIHCPVGSPAVPGKQPMEVAVSIAAEVIERYHRDLPPRDDKVNSVQWRQLKTLLTDP